MRRAGKYLGRTILVLALGTGLLFGAAVFFTGVVAERVLPLVAHRLKLTLRVGDVGGNLLTGVTLRDLTLELPKAVVRIPKARADLRLAALWRRRLVFEQVTVSSPSVVILKSTAPAAPKPPKPAGAGGGFPIEVESLRLDDGLVRWGEPGPYGEAADIDAELSFLGGRAGIERASAEVADHDWRAAGAVDLRPFAADLKLETRGAVSGTAEVRGSTQNFTVQALGVFEDAPWKLEARLMNGKAWRGRGDFARLDLRRAGKAPPWLGPLAGSAEFQGTGFAPAKISAKAQWEVRAAAGPAAKGTASLERGVARWEAEIKGQGVTAQTTGGFDLAQKRLVSEGRLRTDAGALKAYTKTLTLAADARWKAEGVLPRLEWEAAGDFKDVVAGQTRVARGRFNLAGTAPNPLFVDGDVIVQGLQAGPRPVDDIQLTLHGGLADHRLNFFVRSGTVTLAAAGEGGWARSAWTMEWEKMSAYDGRRWESTGPFKTVIGNGRFALQDFALRAGKAVLAADIAFHDGTFSRLDARARGVDSRPWAAAGLWPLPAHGVLSVEASFRGEPPFLDGALKAVVNDLRWNQTALGNVVVDSTLDDRALRLGPSYWDSPGGSVSVRGVIPLYTENKRLPAIDLAVNTRELNLDFAAPLIPNARFKDARFTSDLRLSSHDGVLQAAGTARLKAALLTFLTKDMRLEDVKLTLAAQGDKLRIVEGHADSPKRGGVDVTGTLTMKGPNINIGASNFQLALAKPNVIGRVEGNLGISGAWGAPHISGEMQIREADIMPGVRDENRGPLAFLGRKKAAAPAKKAKPTPMTMDFNVWFKRQVWYKDGDTAIEVKGGMSVTKRPYEPVAVLGVIETIRGDYYVYGKEFEVEEGKILLVGDSPPDPELDIRAVYKAPDSGTVITLRITGTAKKPELERTSDPPLSDQDIMSVLVFGVTQDELAAGDESGGEDQALAAVSSVVFSEIRQTALIKQLDLDVLRLRQQGEDRQLEVGRYLSDDLFLVYEQTLEEDGDKRVGAEYTLNPRWTLSGRSGSRGNHSLDLLFNYPLN